MFDSAEEVHQKLSNCIVLHNGKPFFVMQGLSDSLDVKGYYLEDPDREIVKVSSQDEAMDYRRLGSLLGYMNVKTYRGVTYNESVYVMRQPRRASSGTQGLSQSNVYVPGFKGSNCLDTNETGAVKFNNDFYGSDQYRGFLDMLSGVYPDMSSIVQGFQDSNLVSCAFDRRWAVERDPIGPFNLMYKNTRVGYTEDFNRFVIADRYRFLRSDLRHLPGVA